MSMIVPAAGLARLMAPGDPVSASATSTESTAVMRAVGIELLTVRLDLDRD